jgi:hypothetical protein
MILAKSKYQANDTLIDSMEKVAKGSPEVITSRLDIPKRQVIVPVYDKYLRVAKWLEAWRDVREKGGLPSNVLLDDILVCPGDVEQLSTKDHYYNVWIGMWAKEILVYPEVNGKFKKGIDVKDDVRETNGRPLWDRGWRCWDWIFPASCIPEEAIGKKGVGLFVDPEAIEDREGNVVILAKPESVIVITPFMQRSGWGKVDDKTRVPLQTPVKDLPFDQVRYFLRTKGSGVRPIARYYGKKSNRALDLNSEWERKRGVAYVELQGQTELEEKQNLQRLQTAVEAVVRSRDLANVIVKELVSSGRIGIEEAEKLQALLRDAEKLTSLV